MISAKKSVDKIEDAPEAAVKVAVEVETKPFKVVTGRPNDTPIRQPAPEHTNSTFASRARAAGKRIGSASNKAVTAEESKAK